jgi:hypothetical protein
MTENAAAHASREAARLTIELNRKGDPSGLARRLMPTKPDADPLAVLSALGRRVYDAVDRVVAQHNAGEPDEEVRDQYSQLAERHPETDLLWDDDPEPATYSTADAD